jgi:hypothetical protein
MCHLQQLHEQFQEEGLAILGFNCSDDKQIAIEFLAENGATFPTILDASDEATKVGFQDYRISGVPVNYIIDQEGKVVDAWYGYQEGHARALAALKKASGELAEAIEQLQAATAVQSAPEVLFAAERLFKAIRSADYEHDWAGTEDWRRFPADDVDYSVYHSRLDWVRWVCKKFKANPIADVRLGEVFPGSEGNPTVHFELVLEDGEVWQGDLPFRWDPKEEQWTGWRGLDWHLQHERNLLELTKRMGIVPDLSEVGQGLPPKVDVIPGSPAEKAGLRSGDRIVALNDQKIERLEDMPAIWGKLKLFNGLRLTVDRDGKQVELKLFDFIRGLLESSDQGTTSE